MSDPNVHMKKCEQLNDAIREISRLRDQRDRAMELLEHVLDQNQKAQRGSFDSDLELGDYSQLRSEIEQEGGDA